MNNRLQSVPNTCCHTKETNSCCDNMNYDPLQTMPLAMAYVPWQKWQHVYEACKGLENGTIFEELIFPFQHASHVCSNMNCNNRMNRQYYNDSYYAMDCPQNNSINHTCNYNRCGNETSNRCERRCN